MIKAIRVRNFRSLLSARVEGLEQLNIIVGPNGIGKTNLIESLAVLGAAISGDLSAESLRQRGVRTGWRFLSSFAQPGDKIVLEATGTDGVSYSVELTESPSGLLYHREILQSDDGSIFVRREGNTYVFLEKGEIALHKGVVPIVLPFLTQKRGLVERLSKFKVYHFPGQLDEENVEALEVMINAFDGGVLERILQELLYLERNISVTDSGSERRLSVHTEMGEMPLSSLGEGFANMLRSLTPCLLPERFPPSFAVDGFGQGLHPRTAFKAVVMTKKALIDTPDRQILLTTHVPDVLDGAVAASGCKLIVLSHRKDGGVVEESVWVEDCDRLRKEMKELEGAYNSPSELFWEGWLGGVPPIFL